MGRSGSKSLKTDPARDPIWLEVVKVYKNTGGPQPED